MEIEDAEVVIAPTTELDEAVVEVAVFRALGVDEELLLLLLFETRFM